MKWLLLGFLAYGFIASQQPGTKTHEAAKEAEQNLNPKKLFNLDDYKSKILPSSTTPLRVKELQSGNGQPVICGQEVTVAYDAFLADGKPIDDHATKEKPLVFTVGENKAMPALENGVIGMEKGGKRGLVSEPKLAYGDKTFARTDVPADATVRFDLELLDVKPTLPNIAETPFRIATVRMGNGKGIYCGNSVTANVTVWSVDGKKLYSTKDKGHNPITFTPGKSQVFLGLEQGVLGMSAGGRAHAGRAAGVAKTYER